MDLYPTMLEAAGLDPDPDKPLDGESILPLLRQGGPLRRQAIYFHYPNYAFHGNNRLGGAIRAGDYKLIEHYDDGSAELYNLADDIGIRHVGVVFNKVPEDVNLEALVEHLEGLPVLGHIPHDPDIARADFEGRSVWPPSETVRRSVVGIADRLKEPDRDGT